MTTVANAGTVRLITCMSCHIKLVGQPMFCTDYRPQLFGPK